MPVWIPDKVGYGEHEDRGSRFLAWVFLAEEEEVFAKQLEQVKAEHPKARHWCWAWRIQEAYRFEDDGEPGGTAGRPMLQVLEGRSLSRVGAVCVRYFGGVKLGTGGLMRAYGGATAKAADDAGVQEVIPRMRIPVFLSFARTAVREEVRVKFPTAVFEGDFQDAGWSGTVEVDKFDAPAIHELFWEPLRGS